MPPLPPLERLHHVHDFDADADAALRRISAQQQARGNSATFTMSFKKDEETGVSSFYQDKVRRRRQQRRKG